MLAILTEPPKVLVTAPLASLTLKLTPLKLTAPIEKALTVAAIDHVFAAVYVPALEIAVLPTLTKEVREKDPTAPFVTATLRAVRPRLIPPIVRDEILPDAVHDVAELPEAEIVTAVPAILAPPDSEKVIVRLLLTIDIVGFVRATDPRLILAPEDSDKE